jgi:hypothetical protein
VSLNQSCKHRRSLQYIDAIVSSRHAKESMQNPELLISQSFKYHSALYGMTRKWAILQSPMYKIDVAKHTRKSSCCILCQDSSCLFFIWCSQIGWSKHYQLSGKTCRRYQIMWSLTCIDSRLQYSEVLHMQYTAWKLCIFKPMTFPTIRWSLSCTWSSRRTLWCRTQCTWAAPCSY